MLTFPQVEDTSCTRENVNRTDSNYSGHRGTQRRHRDAQNWENLLLLYEYPPLVEKVVYD